MAECEFLHASLERVEAVSRGPKPEQLIPNDSNTIIEFFKHNVKMTLSELAEEVVNTYILNGIEV